MSAYRFGFIGAGNMGGALASAVCKAITPKEVVISDAAASKAEILAEELGCLCSDTDTVAEKARFIFLGVKPQVMEKVLKTISPILAKREDRFILVTMAAGLKLSSIAEMLGFDCPIIRIMPNTPVSVEKGMILYTYSDKVFMDEVGELCDGLKYAGRLDKIEEHLIDAASAVSGCGPAFVYMFAESLADAGVECGLPRNKALEYASQTLSGAAELLLTSGKHPGELKDTVCSPAGSTIAGVHALEENSFRGSVIKGVTAAFDRTKELGRK